MIGASRRRRLRDAGVLALLAGAVGVWVYGCASAAMPSYGDPDCVPGGCGVTVSTGTNGSTASAGGTCIADAGCAVSYQTDIYTGIIQGTGCTNMGCHDAVSMGTGLMLTSASTSYTNLLAYPFPSPAGPYIAPCDPGNSKMLCNMNVGDAGPAPTCTPAMPLTAAIQPGGMAGTPLTATQLNELTEWIACGAPDN
jgi:hypothetical protein